MCSWFTYVALVCALLLCCCSIQPAEANIDLAVTDDTRRVIDLGVFPFSSRGVFSLSLKQFNIKETQYMTSQAPIGFTLDLVPSAVLARQEKNYGKTEEVDSKICFIEDPKVQPKSPPPNWRQLVNLRDVLANGTAITRDAPFRKSFRIETPGLYALFFYNCKSYLSSAQGTAAATIHVSFDVSVEEYNVNLDGERNYLGIGLEAAPKVYYCFSIVYLGLLVLWVREWRRNAAHVHRIHYLMTALLVFKTLAVFFNGMKFRSHALTGEVTAWDVFFYIFLTLRGVFLFAVVLLLGTGWSYLKPFLGDRDKKVLMAILPMQIIVNIAIAVMDESSEGNANWAAWRDVLHVLDIVCCCCVLLPVVWSIKNLRDASETDGKVAQNLQRLRQFRTFYIVVVAYIYFTRIGVVLLEASLPYTMLWVAYFVHETGSLFFYTYVGMKFRPQAQSPYLAVPNSEDMDELQAREELDMA
eukprot:PhM_4_TR5023/c0_g1_i1/m.105928